MTILEARNTGTCHRYLEFSRIDTWTLRVFRNQVPDTAVRVSWVFPWYLLEYTGIPDTHEHPTPICIPRLHMQNLDDELALALSAHFRGVFTFHFPLFFLDTLDKTKLQSTHDEELNRSTALRPLFRTPASCCQVQFPFGPSSWRTEEALEAHNTAIYRGKCKDLMQVSGQVPIDEARVRRENYRTR